MYSYTQWKANEMTEEKFMKENNIVGVSPLFGASNNLKSLMSRDKVGRIQVIDFENGIVKNMYFDNQRRLVCVVQEPKGN